MDEKNNSRGNIKGRHRDNHVVVSVSVDILTSFQLYILDTVSGRFRPDFAPFSVL